MIRALLARLTTRPSPATPGEWYARSQAGSLTSDERRQFEAWLAARPENREAYARSARLAELGDGLRARADLVTEMPAYAALREATKASSRPLPAERRTLQWALGSALVAGAFAAAVLWVVPRAVAPDSPAQVATRHGEQRELPLEDGTRVHLNTDSSISVQFSDRERRVVLARGEGFFDVTKDAARPFVVQVGNTEVRVIGTRFSVRDSDAGVKVIVSEGKVEVVPNVRRHSPSIPTKVELAPGNALRFDRVRDEVRVAAVDPERATAWRTGMIDFDNATIEEVVAEVNRYAGKPLVIGHERIKPMRLSGSFKVGDVESVCFVLRDGFGVEPVVESGRILLR